MSKQSLTPEKTATKQQTKPQPTVNPLARLIEDAELFSMNEKESAKGTQFGERRIPLLQRQLIATKISIFQSNHRLQRILQSVIQRESPPGHGISTAFGTYWIVPDDTNQTYLVEGEQITESEFAELEKIWNLLQSGLGQIVIAENDDKGKQHSGFKSKILNQFGKLLSQPQGRGLVTGLVVGSKTVTILPSSQKVYANAKRGSGSEEVLPGVAGVGGTTAIQIDDNLQDDSVVVFDATGKVIGMPVFIALGHELIHAQHNAAGRNRRSQTATSSAYTNLEEEETIASGSLTENTLRAEHNLPKRFGHAGRQRNP